jgi:predicted TIM-barrel fold metal-dependent hydrolase
VIFDPTFGIGPVAFADISEDDKRKILGENAERLMDEIVVG